MSYRVELRDNKSSESKEIYLVNGRNEKKIGFYSSAKVGFRLRCDPTIRVLGGDSKDGNFVPLPFKSIKKSLEVRTSRLFWKLFSCGSELGVIDVKKDEFISALK